MQISGAIHQGEPIKVYLLGIFFNVAQNPKSQIAI
jgi:hypothetical protein